MSELIPIGRFAHITQLTPKALRLYAEAGLLEPASVDPETGYRYYSPGQVAVAARIRLLRMADMSIPDIRMVLRASSATAVTQLLTRHQQVLTARMARDQEALLLLERLLVTPERLRSFDVQLKAVPEQPFLSLRRRTTYGNFGPVIRGALATVIEHAERWGSYRPEMPPVIVHHQYDAAHLRDQETILEVGVPTRMLVPVEGELTSSLLPGGMVAAVVHLGSYHELEVIYPALGIWIEEHQHTLAGPPRIAILTNHAVVTNPAEYQTEVQWPIAGEEGARVST